MEKLGGNSDLGCDDEERGIQALSEEMAVYLFRFCSLQSKYSLTLVSKYYRRLVSDKALKLKEGLLEVAISITEKQDYKRGIIVLQRICHLFPHCADVWKEVGLCYKQMEDYENSIDSLFVAYDNCDGPFRLYIESQIYLYAKTNGIELAYARICEAISQEPGELKYYHFRAFIEAAIQSSFSNSDEDMTEKHQQSLTREFQDYEFISGKPYARMASIYNNIGAVYFEQGFVEKALEFFDKSLGLCPAYVQAFFNKAIAWRSIGSARHALMEYDSILRANPACKRVHTLKGQCYYALRLYNAAEGEFYTGFLQGFTHDNLEYDSINGFYKCVIRTKNVSRLFAYLPQAIDRLAARVRETSLQLASGPTDLGYAGADAAWRQALREEARIKQYSKQRTEALNALKLAVRIHAEMALARDAADGVASQPQYLDLATEFEFADELGDFIPFVQSRLTLCENPDSHEPLTVHPTPLPHRARKSTERKSPRGRPAPIGEYGSIGDRSGDETPREANGRHKRSFYWNFLVSLGDCANLEDILNRKKEPHFELQTLQSQALFITSFAYFYLGLHSPPHASLSLVSQFIEWLTLQREQKTVLSAISSSYYVIIYLFEIFKLTETAPDKRSQLLTVLHEKIERLIQLKRNVSSLCQARDSLSPMGTPPYYGTSLSRSGSDSSRSDHKPCHLNCNELNQNGSEFSYPDALPVHDVNYSGVDEVLAQALLAMLSLHGDAQGSEGEEEEAEYVEDVFLFRDYERRRDELQRRDRLLHTEPAPLPSLLLCESTTTNDANHAFIIENCAMFYVDLYDLVRYTVLAIGIPVFSVSYF